jgi:hypothetical protein
MNLATWKSDRVVESFIYSRQRPSAQRLTTRPAEAGATWAQDDNQQRAQSLFNRVCERAAVLIFPSLAAGLPIDDVVDAVFDDDDWNESMRDLTKLEEELRAARTRDDEPETVEGRFPWALNRDMSPKTKALARRCVRLMNATFDAHKNLIASGQVVNSTKSREEQLEDHLWFLSDSAFPRDLRRALLAQRRGAVAMLATYPVTAGPAPAREHFRSVLQLLEHTAKCYEEYLSVIANYPVARVTIVPPDGSDLTVPAEDPVAPFREAMRRAGESVVDPA